MKNYFHADRLRGLGVSHVLNAVRIKPDISSRAPDGGSGDEINRESMNRANSCQLNAAFLEKCLRPAYSLWTYHGLFEDLKTDFSSAKGRLVSEIQSRLSWPGQTITFWPVTQRNMEPEARDKDFFNQGLSIIKPVYIFCFGAAAYKIITPNNSFVYGKKMINDMSILALPSLESMLPDNRMLKNLTWNLLKQFSP